MLPRTLKFTEVALSFRSENEVPASFSDRLAAALDRDPAEDISVESPETLFAGFTRLGYAKRVRVANHIFSERWHRFDDLRAGTGMVRERNGPSAFLLDLKHNSYRALTPHIDTAQPVLVFDSTTTRTPGADRERNMLSYRHRVVDRSAGVRHGFTTTLWKTECAVALTNSEPPCRDFGITVRSDIEAAANVGTAFGDRFVPDDAYGTHWYGPLMTRFVRGALAEAGCAVAVSEAASELPAAEPAHFTPESGRLLFLEKTAIDVVECTSRGVVRDHIVHVLERGHVEVVEADDDLPPLDGLREQTA